MENKVEKKLNIFQRMQSISNEISSVGKDLSVDMGNGKSYKAVSEANILEAVKPLEAKFGVYSYPFNREVIENAELITNSKYGEKRSLYMRLKVVYRFVNVDDPKEYVDIISYGDGVDTQDKAPGKAMTYADKYALMKAYKISTGDDPDAQGSEELKKLNKPTEENPYGIPNFVPQNIQPKSTLGEVTNYFDPTNQITEHQLLLLGNQKPDIITWIKNTFHVQELAQLTSGQADAIITKMKERGAIK